MVRGVNRWVRLLLEPGPAPLLFLVGTTLLAMLGNAVYDLVKDLLGSALGVLVVAIALLLCILGLIAFIRRVFKTELAVREVGRRPALIALVSVGKLSTIPACGAIKYHYRGLEDEHQEPVLRHCWLISSPKPEEEPEQRGGGEPFQSSWKNAQNLRAKYESLGVNVRIQPVSPEDPQAVFEVVDAIYREVKALNIKSSEVIADFTGGTKVMTAGMVLACTPGDRDVQYMRPRRYLSDGRADPDAGADPVWVDLSIAVQSTEP
jgi:hypothetical protein